MLTRMVMKLMMNLKLLIKKEYESLEKKKYKKLKKKKKINLC